MEQPPLPRAPRPTTTPRPLAAESAPTGWQLSGAECAGQDLWAALTAVGRERGYRGVRTYLCASVSPLPLLLTVLCRASCHTHTVYGSPAPGGLARLRAAACGGGWVLGCGSTTPYLYCSCGRCGRLAATSLVRERGAVDGRVEEFRIKRTISPNNNSLRKRAWSCDTNSNKRHTRTGIHPTCTGKEYDRPCFTHAHRSHESTNMRAQRCCCLVRVCDVCVACVCVFGGGRGWGGFSHSSLSVPVRINPSTRRRWTRPPRV